jgi:hypothetical protein
VIDDNSSTAADDFVLFDRTIQSNAAPNPVDLSPLSISDGNDINELKLKVASLEVNILELNNYSNNNNFSLKLMFLGQKCDCGSQVEGPGTKGTN